MKNKILLLILCLLLCLSSKKTYTNVYNIELLFDGNCSSGHYEKTGDKGFTDFYDSNTRPICGATTNNTSSEECMDVNKCGNRSSGEYVCTVYSAKFVCDDNKSTTTTVKNVGSGGSSNSNWNNLTDGVDTNDCSSLGNFKGDLENIFKAFKIVAPILTLVLSSFEFLSAITSKQAEGLKGATKKFTTRLVLVVILYFLPIILDLILDLAFPGASTCIR